MFLHGTQDLHAEPENLKASSIGLTKSSLGGRIGLPPRDLEGNNPICQEKILFLGDHGVFSLDFLGYSAGRKGIWNTGESGRANKRPGTFRTPG